MQEAIDKALAWGRSRGLQFSGPKTVAVLFTHKRDTPPLEVGGTELLYFNHVQYLGVELDSNCPGRDTFSKGQNGKIKAYAHMTCDKKAI